MHVECSQYIKGKACLGFKGHGILDAINFSLWTFYVALVESYILSVPLPKGNLPTMEGLRVEMSLLMLKVHWSP